MLKAPQELPVTLCGPDTRLFWMSLNWQHQHLQTFNVGYGLILRLLLITSHSCELSYDIDEYKYYGGMI